jgi:SAM-dependent methyltransferase
MNRFFNKNDKSVYELGKYNVSKKWWSRVYEYALAKDYLNKDDVILDAGCGVVHPFKHYASEVVKKVYAVDIDEKIKEFENSYVLKYKCMSLVDLDKEFQEKTFDKIFCISVLEHIPEIALKVLEQFKKVLKDDGLIIITLDYPMIKTEDVVNMAKKLELEFVSGHDYTITSDAIKAPDLGIKCFSAILKKKIEKIEKPVIEYETKVIVPEETQEEKIIPIIPKKRGRKPKK